MAMKRKLSETIELMTGKSDISTVHINIPKPDNAADIIRGSKMFVDTVTELANERDDLKRRNEELMRRCIVITNENKLLRKERDRAIHQTNKYARANGVVAATIGAMLALAEDARKGAVVVQEECDYMPLEELPAPTPAPVLQPYDSNGIPIAADNSTAPEPTLEDIASLQTVLARAEG